MSSPSFKSARSTLLGFFTLLVFGFLYLPIAVLILYSFNRDGVGGFPPLHFTLDWYRQLFADAAIWDSVLNSLLVAVRAVALSLTLGLLAALALDRAAFPGNPSGMVRAPARRTRLQWRSGSRAMSRRGVLSW